MTNELMTNDGVTFNHISKPTTQVGVLCTSLRYGFFVAKKDNKKNRFFKGKNLTPST
jgi:hypothetical protein